MKRVVFILAFFLTSGLAFAQDAGTPVEGEKIDLDGPYIAFTESTFNFKEIYQGDEVEHIFQFENTGTADLIISNVQTTCGCTVPQWPRTAIAPGEKQELKVVFNSRGKMGRQNKIITVVSNAVNNPERVKLQGIVLPPKPAESDSDSQN